MGVYQYIATDPASGAAHRGELVADSAYQVRAALRKMALLPVQVRELQHAVPASAKPMNASGQGVSVRSLRHAAKGVTARLAARVFSRRGRRRAQLVEFYESMASLVGTGTTLAAGLEVIAASPGGTGRGSRGGSSLQSLALVLVDRVRGGESLAGAMDAPPGPAWFGPVDRALVRVASESGELERTLSDLAEHHARAQRLEGKLAAVLAYPALLVVFGLGVVVFLTTTTLPPLAAVLQDAGVALPGPTVILLALGGFIVHWWFMAIPLAVVLIGAGGWLATSDRWARARARAPLLGRALVRGQLGELCTLLARLLKGGVPLVESLELAGTSVSNAALRTALGRFARALENGRDASGALRESDLFEPVFCRVMEVGQASGELAPALETLGRRYRDSAARLTDRLAAALEPTVILLLAAMVGFVVYAAITPMLKLSQTIH